MQANSDTRDDRDDGDHGVDIDNNGALVGINAQLRFLAADGSTSTGPPMNNIPIEDAVRMAMIISRRYSYAELMDLDNNCILAVFLWGNQLALNRAWRDEYDPKWVSTTQKEAGNE